MNAQDEQTNQTQSELPVTWPTTPRCEHTPSPQFDKGHAGGMLLDRDILYIIKVEVGVTLSILLGPGSWVMAQVTASKLECGPGSGVRC